MTTRKIVKKAPVKITSPPVTVTPAPTPVATPPPVVTPTVGGAAVAGGGNPVVGTPATPGQGAGSAVTDSAAQPGAEQGPSAAARAAAQGPAGAVQGPATGVQGPATSVATPALPTAHGTVGATAHKGKRGKTPGLQATLLLRKPKGNQSELAAAMAGEIRRSIAAGTYRTYFSVHAPDPVEFATELEQAGALTVQESQERVRWVTVRNERNKAWDQVLTEKVDAFLPCFELAVAHDGNVATEFQTAGVFLRTNKTIGARGAATRKAKRIVGTPAGG